MDGHTEFSGQMAFHPNVNANGTPGVSRTTLTLSDEPELRIDFNQLVSTGLLSARSANVYGGGLGASWHNLLLQGEYYQINLDQSKLPWLFSTTFQTISARTELACIFLNSTRSYST